MNIEKCGACIERRQLDFIQRVGRIGYFEYVPQERSIIMPDASLALLASMVGGAVPAPGSFMEALSEVERRRMQSALDEAIARRLALEIELELTAQNGLHSTILVRGAAVGGDQFPFRFACTFQDITDQKLRETDHEKTITQLRALLDALPQGVSVIDKDLRLILWNRQFHEILDLPQSMVFPHARFEDFIRFNAQRGFFGPGDPDEQVRIAVAGVSEFMPHRFERRLPGGGTVLVEGFPFKTGEQISGLVSTYTDITEQKRSEEQLTRQRDVMKTIIENFPGGISLCDVDLKFTTYNEQFLTLLDFPPSLFAKGWAHFEELARFNANRGEYGPGDVEQQVKAVVARAENFQAHRIERMRPNGRWLEIRGTPIASGGFVTNYLDITERKLAEQALEKSEERWKFALEGANDGVWDWDFQSDEVLYSKRWKEMFGYAEDEMGNARSEWFNRVHPDDLPRVVEIIERHLYSHTPAPSVEYRMRCKDGSWKWTLGRGMVVSRDDQGEPLRLVGTNTDISARKMIEQELVHSKEMAEARREQVANLLDNSGEGFLSFGSDLIVDAECSRACETMLGRSPAGCEAAELLFAGDIVKAELLRATVPTALAESDPWLCATMLSLLPREFRLGDKLLKADYKRLDNGRAMVVLTDVTAERRLERKVETERRRLEMIVAAVTDSRDFFDTLEAFREFAASGLQAILDTQAEPASIARELYRQVHTFKGLMNQFSFLETPLVLHDLESRLEQLRQRGGAVSRRQIAEAVAVTPFEASLAADLAILRDALGPEFLEYGDRIFVGAAQAEQLRHLAERLLRGERVDASIGGMRRLLLEISQLHKVPLKDVLGSFDRLIRQTAGRLEKEVAALRMRGGENVWIDPKAYRSFLRALTHVFRNAVVHGIEDPDSRLAIGKEETGTITCSIDLDGTNLKLSIADDGAGIDIDALRRRAVGAGLIAEEQVATAADEQILDLIFLDNFSTRQETSELAGRGVGLAVVRSETRKLKGDVVVKSIAGQGSEFLFTLPLQP